MAYGAIIGQTPTVQASAEMTSYNNDNTNSVITADNVQGAIDQLFTSVSNGKSQIASAITDMGVSTSANDSFAQMATNISNIETGPDWSEVQNPAEAAQILAPYQTYNSSNKLIKGTITSKGAQTYTPKTVSQTIAKGQYLSGNQTIQGDENLKASNIIEGKSIFGVSGKAKNIVVLNNVITGVKTTRNERILQLTAPSVNSYFYYGAIPIAVQYRGTNSSGVFSACISENLSSAGSRVDANGYGYVFNQYVEPISMTWDEDTLSLQVSCFENFDNTNNTSSSSQITSSTIVLYNYGNYEG